MALWPCQNPEEDPLVSSWPCQIPEGEDDDAQARREIWWALQISEDTCAKHGVYLCAECFDFSPGVVLDS